MKEISFETLVDWVEGRLAPGEAARVEAWVAEADTAVQADVAWLRRFHRLSQEITLATPPDWVRRRLRRRFQTDIPRPSAPETGRWQRWRGILSFDSRSQAAMAGVRGGLTNAGRQLVYTTEGGEVALNVHPHAADEKVDLLGQLFPPGEDVPLFSVQLLQDGAEIGLTMADDLGEFTFTGLPPVTVSLVCSSDQAELIIPPFYLGPD